MNMLGWLTFVTVAALPAYGLRFHGLGLPMTALEVLILLTFAVWIFVSKRRKFPLWWLVIVWLAVSFVGVIVSGWSVSAFGLWKAYFLEPALLYVVLVNVIDSKEKVMRLITALAIPAIIISVVAIYQYVSGDFISNPVWASAAGRRATSLYSYPNAVGLYLGPLLLLFVGAASMLWQQKRWRMSALYGVVALLSLGGIIAARSDGALFGVAGALVLFGLIANKKLRIATLTLVIAGSLAIAATPSLRDYVGERMMLNDFSGQVRRIQWRETLKMFNDGKIITGAGLGNYQASVAPYHQEGFFYNRDNDVDFVQKVLSDKAYRDSHWQPLEIYLYPHNLILNFWSEIGLAGLLVFIVIVILFFSYGFRSWYRMHAKHDPFAYVVLGLSLSLAVSLIHGIVDVPYFKNDLAALFWLSMGAMTVIASGRFKETE